MKGKLLLASLIALGTVVSCGAADSKSLNVIDEVETSTIETVEPEAEESEIEHIYNLYQQNGGELSYDEWLESIKGADGKDGTDGADGRGIVSIEKTDSIDNVDTYTITYTDGTTSTFEITNGIDGQDGKDGVDGKDGKDGTDGKDGQDGADGKDGTTIYLVGGATEDTDRKETYIDLELNDDFSTYTATITSNYAAKILMPESMTDTYRDGKNWNSAYFVYDKNISFRDVSIVKLGAGCEQVGEISCFPNAKKLLITPYVHNMVDRCLINSAFEEVYFTGTLPEINTTGCRMSNCGIVYVNRNVYATTGDVLQGNLVSVINNTKTLSATTVSVNDYAMAAAEDGLELSAYLAGDTGSDLDEAMKLYPYADVEDYKEIKEFTLDLTKDCTTESEKCEAIFKWIQTNIDYSYKGSTYDVGQTFRNKQGVCSQFASLMHDMLSSVGIVSYYVNGAKYYDYLVSKKGLTTADAINFHYADGYASYNHAWISARVDGEWGYYDANSTYKTLNMNLYNMSLDNLIKYGYLVENIENVHVMPDCISLVDLTGDYFVKYAGKIRNVNNGKLTYGINSTAYFNSMTLEKGTYDPTYTYYSYASMNDTLDNETGCLYRSEFVYAMYKSTSVMRSRLFAVSSSGRKIPATEFLSYLTDLFTEEEISNYLSGLEMTYENGKLSFVA